MAFRPSSARRACFSLPKQMEPNPNQFGSHLPGTPRFTGRFKESLDLFVHTIQQFRKSSISPGSTLPGILARQKNFEPAKEQGGDLSPARPSQPG